MSTGSGDVAISKTQRWLDLIAFLVGRQFPVPVDEVMENVPAYRLKWRTGTETDRASVRRMFERDKDELRAAGIPLETREYRIEGGEVALGYRITGRDFYLPDLRIVGTGDRARGTGDRRRGTGDSREGGATSAALPPGLPRIEVTAEHAQLAMDALRRVAELPDSPFADEARAALAKLRFDLEPPPAGADGPERGEGVRVHEPTPWYDLAPLRPAPVLYAEPPGPSVRDTLRLLVDALRRRARVTFTYHGIRRGSPTRRDVAPYGLLFQHQHWYLIGDDATRGALRVFRLGRMEAVEASRADGEYAIPDDFDVAGYARRQAWELGDDEPLAAHVRFEFPLSLWAERNAQGTEVERLPGGAVVRRFDVRQTDPFLRWLQSFAGDALVVGPPELRRAQAELARATLAVYGEAHGA